VAGLASLTGRRRLGELPTVFECKAVPEKFQGALL
jgi:hypothetical protein